MDKNQDYSSADKEVARRAFDFIDSIRQVKTLDELKTAFNVEVDAFGFQHYLFGRIPLITESAADTVVMDTWPDEWRKRYIEKNYVAWDPAAHAVAFNTLPFTWQDVLERKSVTNRRIFDEARAWQMHHGLCVPVHDLKNLKAFATLSGLEPDLSDAAKSAMHLMVIYAYAKSVELSDAPQQRLSGPRLSPRERECTHWIAAGKSTWEIGEILGLSELTIAAYIKSAMLRLNVVTRAQLVAEALRLGEIAL